LGAAALVVGVAAVAVAGHVFDARLVPVTAGDQHTSRRLALIAFLVVSGYVLLWGSLGLQEVIIRPEAVDRGAHSGLIRYIEIPLWLACGWVADRFGRHVLVVSALVGSLMGAASLLDQSSHGLAVAGDAGITITLAAYTIGGIALIADLSCYARRPAALISFSFAPAVMRQAVHVLAHPIVEATDTSTLFLVDLAVLVVFALIAQAFLELARRNLTVLESATLLVEVPRETPPEPDLDAAAERFGLTKREREVLALSISGLTVPQMAERLVVAPVTVKTHITNLLRKTGAASRADLVSEILPHDSVDLPRPTGPLTALRRRGPAT
jgi:DNA-binding CsgD family transcriptional regulator